MTITPKMGPPNKRWTTFVIPQDIDEPLYYGSGDIKSMPRARFRIDNLTADLSWLQEWGTKVDVNERASAFLAAARNSGQCWPDNGKPIYGDAVFSTVRAAPTFEEIVTILCEATV